MESTIRTEDVWKEFHERLLAFVRRRVAGDQDAEDILQDVFVRIHKNLQQLKDTASTRAWLYQIARNSIVDHHRARARAANVAAKAVETLHTNERAEETERAPDPSAELAQCMRPLVDQLPEPYGEAIRLTELGDLTQKEAAQRLGLSVPGMKARVQRGRRQLRDLLLDCCTVELDRRKGVIDYGARDGGACEERGYEDPDS
jgi:RNA polymerase sigma-70 factor (ECF subfamily)